MPAAHTDAGPCRSEGDPKKEKNSYRRPQIRPRASAFAVGLLRDLTKKRDALVDGEGVRADAGDGLREGQALSERRMRHEEVGPLPAETREAV